MTQRKGNACLTRTSYTSAQCLYPLAEYVAKEMKLKTAITIADDFAFGYEQIGGFHRTLEEDGGRIVKKLWSPLSTADYAPYIAQISDCEVVCVGLAGSNPIKSVKHAKGMGISQKLVGGSTAAHDTITSATMPPASTWTASDRGGPRKDGGKSDQPTNSSMRSDR